MVDSDLDRHEWKSEWQSLEPLIVDSPAEALPEVDRLVERFLTEQGYPTTEEGAAGADDPKLVAEFLEARRLMSRIEAGETEDPSEIGAAITGYRNVYEYLVAEPTAS